MNQKQNISIKIHSSKYRQYKINEDRWGKINEERTSFFIIYFIIISWIRLIVHYIIYIIVIFYQLCVKMAEEMNFRYLFLLLLGLVILKTFYLWYQKYRYEPELVLFNI